MDATDKKLLSLLVQNAKTPYAELGKKLGLSAPAVHARVKRMEKDGVLERFTVKVNPASTEKPVCAFIRLSLHNTMNDDVAKFLEKIPEVEEAHGVAGEDCMLVKVRVRDPLALNDLLSRIKKAPGFQKSITMLVLKTFFENGATP